MDTILENDLFEAFAEASSHVYIYVCDVEKDWSRWSAHAIEYFDLPGEYMEHAGEIWMSKIHPEDRKKYQADIEAVFGGKKMKHKCEYRVMNRYGDYVWLECRGTMVMDEGNRPKIFAGMMTRLDARNKYDPLTNLKTFYEFNNIDFSEGQGSVLLIGVDNFRTVINNYGYSFGDIVLQEFCRRLAQFCGGGREAFRLEGDEFIIVSRQSDRKDTRLLFEEVQKLGKDLAMAQNRLISIRVSGGAVLYPGHGQRRENILTNLEHSLEHAKKYARGKLVFFSTEIALHHNQKTRLLQSLERAIQNNFEGFELFFQPMIKNKNYEVVSCEALLRWKQDDGNYGNTAEIIKLLESSGKIIEVGSWVAEEAFKKARQWQGCADNFRIGFNVSYIQFKDSTFVDFLIDKAEEYQVNPKLISIELTESSMVDDFAYLAQCFTRLRDFGFRISLDDFGIAYSTLLLIKNLPTDSVKIDHSFVRNLTKENTIDLAIIDSVVSLCRNLKISVVAEGVESKEILDIVEQFPITYLQGYYFDKPMPAEQFEKQILKI